MSRPADLKQALIDSGEEWNTSWDNVLQASPSYLAAYVKLRQVPIQKQKLPRKIQELILLAIDAQCTHLHAPGVRLHIEEARKAGASVGEIIETLEMASVLGVHSVTVGVELLQEVLAEKGQTLSAEDRDLSPRQQALKDNFVRQRGYWSGTWSPVLQLSPEFFAAYTEYSSVPFQEGHSFLESYVKELVYCAIDCATTHLFAPGLKIHIRNAIEKGASAEQVLEVFELAALMGAKTVVMGVDAVAEIEKG
ncbi:gamma-carboxymuconolactone decarboxylase like [Lecanosticta acicola]|uniref:Gamma-carboxymuconolactone decarboxylase like n=1 Tax=Lecanosticta acicola TaxID=111012 RepID=A0AAI8W1E0_9PEZI|nr:gamma-carboxymuconolactone decarboxylase like [Lecanosticta acicola]